LKKDIVIWGGTGNFKVLCELLKDDYRVMGYFDNNPEIEKEYKGIPWLGDREAFLEWVKGIPTGSRPHFIVSIGPGHGKTRLEIHDELNSHGLQPVVAIHRSAFVAENATIGEGSQVYAMATVGVDTRIGKACIINTRASVDHECIIGDGASVGPGAILAGLVKVEKNADVYTGAVILPRLTVGEGAIVGAGAVVLENVAPYTVVAGNPARVIKNRTV